MAGGSGSCAGSACGGSTDDSGTESDVVGGVWVSDTGRVVAGREADSAWVPDTDGIVDGREADGVWVPDTDGAVDA